MSTKKSKAATPARAAKAEKPLLMKEKVILPRRDGNFDWAARVYVRGIQGAVAEAGGTAKEKPAAKQAAADALAKLLQSEAVQKAAEQGHSLRETRRAARKKRGSK